MDNKNQFWVQVKLNGRQIHHQNIDDPFVHTTTRINLSIYDAIKALFGKLVINFVVDGTPEAHRVVFAGDYTRSPEYAAIVMGDCNGARR